MLQIREVAFSEQSCDSLTGQEERASIEHPAAAGHLQKYSQSQQRMARDIRQTFHLVYIV